MIEAGLAIIACCLPTLQALLPKDRVQSLIAGLRSMASFRPLRSGSTSPHTRFNRRRWPFSKIGSVKEGADDGLALKHLNTTASLSKPTSAHEEPNISQKDNVV